MAGTREFADGFESTEALSPVITKVIKTVEKEVDIGAAETSCSFTITISALTHTIVCFLPAWSAAVTGQITITNSDGREIYASVDTLAKNTVHVLAVEKPLVGENTITITLDGAPGGTGGTTATSIYLTGN